MNFAFWKNALKQAIERGLASGDLRHELSEFKDHALASRKDGEAVCWGLQRLNATTGATLAENAYQLAKLFMDVRDAGCPAVEVLREKGIPELMRLYDEARAIKQPGDSSNLLYLLKILAIYGTTDGVLKIIEAAQEPFASDNYVWSVILQNFERGHPQNSLLFSALTDPLPEGFIAISLLDAANHCMIDGEEMIHPFDSDGGTERLRNWILSERDGEYSYARSACAAMPFLKHQRRDELLVLAASHPDKTIRTESAWAEAKCGRKSGLRRLTDLCLDLQTSVTARQYLKELGRSEVIPSEVSNPDFLALSEFSHWLAHPSELGRHPDSLEIVDQRELAWPPDQTKRPFWLIKYVLKDEMGLEDDDEECGLVGSVTFCLFSYKLSQRPPEDAYAIHCCWEMTNANLIEEHDVTEDPSEYAVLLGHWQGAPLGAAAMLKVAELSPKLGLKERLVGLASATLNDNAGWVVLDGTHSEWYPQTDFPFDCQDSVVLRVHIGRRLLAFTGKADRAKYLKGSPPVRAPEQIISAYEKLLDSAAQTKGKGREDALSLTWSPVGKHLGTYSKALAETGKGVAIRKVIDLLQGGAEKLGGYSTLGEAAFVCGQDDLAEELLIKRKDQGVSASVERGESMSILARLWYKRGKQGEARQLLVDCLMPLLSESKTATGPDRQMVESWFQTHRQTYLQLFHPSADEELKQAGIPSTTL